MSVVLPGSSIHFDGTDFQHNEEEERQQEEIQQQQELHALLTAELPDDLLHEHSFNNGGSANTSSRDNENHSYHSAQGWEHSPKHTSRSCSPYGKQLDYSTNDGAKSFERELTDAEKWQISQQQSPYGKAPQNQRQYSYGHKQSFKQREDAVGSYGYKAPPMGYNLNAYQGSKHAHHGPSESDVYGFAERREAEGSEDFDAFVDQSYTENNRLSTTLPSPKGLSSPAKEVRFDVFSEPSSPYASHPQQVQYKHHKHSRPFKNTHNSDEFPTKISSRKSISIESTPSLSNQYETGGKQDHNKSDVSELQRELEQLQILYEARGKKMERLSKEIDKLEEDKGREKRILNHQLAMAKDQKDGMSGSLEECQRLLVEKDRQLNEKEGICNAFSIELDALKDAKADLIKKLEVGERTIENLRQEMGLFQRSDAIERARQQHDAVLSATQEKHERDMLEVTSMLDEARQLSDSKTEECDELKTRLKTALKDSEDVLLEKSETINRLSRSLEEAQNQCQDLLAGGGEVGYLKRQITEYENNTSRLAEENRKLKVTLDDLEEQVTMYENALHLGITSEQQDVLGESYTELMGNNVTKNLDWKTPTNNKPVNNASGDSSSSGKVVDGLRKELERALTKNKDKRNQVVRLEKQIDELTNESRHWRERVDELETQSKKGNARCIQPANDNIDSLAMEDLQRQMRNATERVEEAEQLKLQLEDTCQELKDQMLEMIEQHDANKQDAVDRCERALMQLHEDAKLVLRDELLAEHEQRIFELSVEHDGQIMDIKRENEKLALELSEVKQSYVQVCAEKEHSVKELYEKFKEEKQAFEDGKQMEMQEKEQIIQKRLEEVRSDTEAMYQERLQKALDSERKEWEGNKAKEIELKLDQLQKEMKEEEQSSLERAISIAQLNWISDQKNKLASDVEKQVEKAVLDARKEWDSKEGAHSMKALNEKVEIIKRQHEVKISDLETSWKLKLEQTIKRKDSEMEDELKTLRLKHQLDYETFTTQHKKSLEKILLNEKDLDQTKDNAVLQKHAKELEDQRIRWSEERDDMIKNHKKELASLEAKHEKWKHEHKSLKKQLFAERDELLAQHKKDMANIEEQHNKQCQQYCEEISRLTTTCSSAHDDISSASLEVKKIQKKYYEEIERIKVRMKEEYRRWKREKNSLVARINDLSNENSNPSKSAEVASSNCSRRDKGISREAFVELQEIYCNALTSIKSEMLQFVRDGREHTLSALEKERQKERMRLNARSRSPDKKNNESYFPSFLQQETRVNDERNVLSSLHLTQENNVLPTSSSPRHSKSRSKSREKKTSCGTRQHHR